MDITSTIIATNIDYSMKWTAFNPNRCQGLAFGLDVAERDPRGNVIIKYSPEIIEFIITDEVTMGFQTTINTSQIHQWEYNFNHSRKKSK